jgi:hypothetical protein
VRLASQVDALRAAAVGHGGWTDEMAAFAGDYSGFDFEVFYYFIILFIFIYIYLCVSSGRVGTVQSVDSDGDLFVDFGGSARVYCWNPASVTAVAPDSGGAATIQVVKRCVDGWFFSFFPHFIF